ncbi:hypothetical protein ACFORG_01140 [Lutimaribacter marinistellae]|uniref:Uncharacterized protein n=1 Tax=Lutimaribacter marinistellae TaxID=1820329 RepID=A0ABV7TAR8_9RHOB
MSYAEYGSLYGKPGVQPLKSPARVYDDAETEKAVKSLLQETAAKHAALDQRGFDAPQSQRAMPLRKGGARASASTGRAPRRGPSLKLSGAIGLLAVTLAFPLLLPALFLLCLVAGGIAWAVLGRDKAEAMARKRAPRLVRGVERLKARVTEMIAGEPHELPEKMLEDPFDRLAERLREG